MKTYTHHIQMNFTELKGWTAENVSTRFSELINVLTRLVLLKWQVNISYIYTHYNLCLQTINILTVISNLWTKEWIEYHILSNELIQSRVWYVKTKDRRGIAQHRHVFIYHHIFLTKNGNSLVPYQSVAVTTFPIKASVVTMYDLH